MPDQKRTEMIATGNSGALFHPSRQRHIIFYYISCRREKKNIAEKEMKNIKKN